MDNRLLFDVIKTAFPKFPMSMNMPIFKDESGNEYVVLGCGWEKGTFNETKIINAANYTVNIMDNTNLIVTESIGVIREGFDMSQFDVYVSYAKEDGSMHDVIALKIDNAFERF